MSERKPPITLITMITIAVQSVTARAANIGTSFRLRYFRMSRSLYKAGMGYRVGGGAARRRSGG